MSPAENNTISFFVPGLARTSGSKSSFYNKKTGKTIITAANPKQKDWQAVVSVFAKQEFGDQTPWPGPLAATMIFVRTRPKGHFGTGRNDGVLKAWAVKKYPTGKPDVLKLGRAVEDAMNGVVYVDDSQIVAERLEKRYGDSPGVHISIRKIDDQSTLTEISSNENDLFNEKK